MLKNCVFDIVSVNLKPTKSLVNLRDNLDLAGFDCLNFSPIEVFDLGYSNGKIKLKIIITRDSILKELERVEAQDQLLKAKKQALKSALNKARLFKKRSQKSIFWNLVFVGCVILALEIFAFMGLRFLKVKDDVLGRSQSAYTNLMNAQNSLMNFNFAFAAKEFSSAFDNFSQAKSGINDLDNVFVNIYDNLSDHKLKSAESLINAGRYVSLAGKEFVNLTQNLLNLVNNIFDSRSLNSFDFNDYDRSLNKISIFLDKIGVNLSSINEASLPMDVKDKIAIFKSKFNILKVVVDKLSTSSSFLYKFLGFDKKKSYFLVFQNNAEIRATGGFWGSYGVLEFENGKIVNLLVDDIYNPDGQLKEKIIPPEPLQKITKYWGLRDSNWFFNFPSSAEKAIEFYQKVNNVNFDGVIAITPKVIEDLLKITGPIDLPGQGVTINSDNFFNTTQYKVEIEPTNRQNRKQILTELAPILVQKLKISQSIHSLDDLQQVLNVLASGLNKKDIMLYFFDNNLQQFISDTNWSGQIFDTDRDYLAVVHNNIGGWKTDRVIKNDIKLNVEIASDGSIINTLEISRTHLGGDSVYFWFNKINKDYLKVYVPLGSELLDVKENGKSVNSVMQNNLHSLSSGISYPKDAKEDFDVKLIESNKKQTHGIDEFLESNKTVFGAWLYTSPKETSTIVFRYKLPFKLNLDKQSDIYSFLLQKQAGADSGFKFNLYFPNSWKIIKSYPIDFKNSTSMDFQMALDSDKYVIVNFVFDSQKL